jgi:aldehyde:ferredoxin oxidoreductase
MNGYCGRILHIDLTTETFSEKPLSEEMAADFIGGSGIAAAIFFDLLGKDCSRVDPLGPDNPLILMTGPLTGTGLPATGRMVACARSPLTGIWGESNVGGFWGPELKRAGWDGVIITGAAREPAVVRIDESGAHVLCSKELWGMDTYETCDRLSGAAAEGRPWRVLAIGQAGENLVSYAAIAHDKRHFLGRVGLGAVMGAKKLKAIAVRGGAGKVTAAIHLAEAHKVSLEQPEMHKVSLAPAEAHKATVARPEEFAALRKGLNAKLKGSFAIEALSAQGTNSVLEVGMYMGDVPVKNWQVGEWDGAEKISGTAFSEKHLVGTRTCFACPVACKREVEVPAGRFLTPTGAGPEYETVGAFGTMLLIDDPAAICKINELCNRLGLDTITCGSTISFAIECFERGLISDEVSGGLELRWSDPDLVIELINQIGEQRDLGRFLALGSARMADRLGPEAKESLTTVKGLEAPMHDPRAGFGLGLAYATGYRGACHVSSVTMNVEQGASLYPLLGLAEGIPDGRTGEGKAEMVKLTQDFGGIFAGAGALCLLGGIPLSDSDLVEVLTAVTGRAWDIGALTACGERIWCLKRVINNLCGVTAEDDALPPRLRQPLAEGASAGAVPDMERMLPEYYRLRGLDERGWPRAEKLEALGLGRVVEVLLHLRQGPPRG